MKIGVAIAAIVKRDHDALIDLQELLMNACNDYRPDTTDADGKPEAPEELDLDEVLRLGIEVWISGVGMERSNPSVPICEVCGEDTTDEGNCGECVNCRMPLCIHHFDAGGRGVDCPLLEGADLRGVAMVKARKEKS